MELQFGLHMRRRRSQDARVWRSRGGRDLLASRDRCLHYSWMTSLADHLSMALRDRYVVDRELGVGGTATVYLATDRKHDRLVAIKVLRPELAAALGVNRFLGEVRITAR